MWCGRGGGVVWLVRGVGWCGVVGTGGEGV